MNDGHDAPQEPTVSTPTTTDNDAFDTPEDQAERDRLDALLPGYVAQQKTLEAAAEKIDEELADVRILLGQVFEDRMARTPPRQKVAWLRAKARELGFELRKAYDNRLYARLHRHNPDYYDRARLARLSVEEVREHAARISENPIAIGKVMERRTAQIADNAVEAAGMILARTKYRDRHRLTELQQQGIKAEALRVWIASSVLRRGEPMTDAERRLGFIKLLLDSGAFRAYTQGIDVDLNAYCDVLLANRWIKLYVNLDRIDPNDPEEGARISYQNFKHMRGRELDPMAVYHYGERIYHLERYLHEEGVSSIGLGGVASNQPQRNAVFFARCFKVIEKAGRPIKVHAFGIAHPATLLQFPFDSADSTAWLIRAQRARSTDLSRLGDRAYRAALYETENNHKLYAAQTLLEAYDGNRLERQIRENPDRRGFNFFLVVPKEENAWWFAALWAVGQNALVSYRPALVSNRPDWNPELVKEFIDDPQSVLSRSRFASKLALLEEMKVQLDNNRREQSWLQDERDRATASPSAAPSLADE